MKYNINKISQVTTSSAGQGQTTSSSTGSQTSQATSSSTGSQTSQATSSSTGSQTSQATSSSTGSQTSQASIKESTFTEADFATAINQFIQGINEFKKIGMIKSDIPSLASSAVGLATSILIAQPGSNYLQRELSLGISKNKNNKNNNVQDIVLSAFSNRVGSRLKSCFNKFRRLIKYSDELTGGSTSPNPLKIDKYTDIKHLILRSSSERDLKKNLFLLIDSISESLNDISEIAGVNFSIIRQFLLLDSAYDTDIGINKNTLSKKKYDLNNIPKPLENKIKVLLSELKSLEKLIEISGEVSGDYTSTYSSQTIGSNSSGSSGSSGSTSGTSGHQGAAVIDTIFDLNNFSYNNSNNSLNLINITSSSSPGFSLEVSAKAGLTEYDLFLALLNTKSIEIIDKQSTNSNTQIIQILSDIKNNPNSNFIRLNSTFDTAKSKYKLIINIPNNVAQIFSQHPGTNLFIIKTRNSRIYIKSNLEKYEFNLGISKISFDIDDLVSNSYNISKLDKKRIINKIKND
jgi:hypothetical protein